MAFNPFEPTKEEKEFNPFEEPEETTWRYPKAFYNGLIAQGGKGAVGLLQGVIDKRLQDAEAVAKEYYPDVQFQRPEGADAAQKYANNASWLQDYNVKGDSTLDQFGLDLTSGAGQLTRQMLAGIVGGPALGAASMLGDIAGSQYLDLINQGVDPETAKNAALSNYTVQAPLEYVGLQKIFSKLPKGSPLRNRMIQYLERFATEGSTEGLQELPEQFSDLYAQNPDASTEEILQMWYKNAPENIKAMGYSALLGGLLGVGGGAVSDLVGGRDYRNEEATPKSNAKETPRAAQERKDKEFNPFDEANEEETADITQPQEAENIQQAENIKQAERLQDTTTDLLQQQDESSQLNNERERFINAIAGQESEGKENRYAAVNERTGASGKYQIMPEYWAGWAEEAGLPADAPMTPENQEIVARFKLGEYYDKYGARGAAMAWYGGEGSLNYSDEALNRKQGKGDEPSINEYADSVLSRMSVATNVNLDNRKVDANADLDVGSAKEFLADWYQNESLPGAERNEVADLLENGSDESIIAKAIEMQQRENQTNAAAETEAEGTANEETNEAKKNIPANEGTVAENAGQNAEQNVEQQEAPMPKATRRMAAATVAAPRAARNEAVKTETSGKALNNLARQTEQVERVAETKKATPVQNNQVEAERKAPQRANQPISGIVENAPALNERNKQYADDLRRNLDDIWRNGNYNRIPLDDDIKQRIEQAVNDYNLPKMLDIRKELKMPMKGAQTLNNYVKMYKAEEETPAKKTPKVAAQAKLPTAPASVREQIETPVKQAAEQEAAPRKQKAVTAKNAAVATTQATNNTQATTTAKAMNNNTQQATTATNATATAATQQAAEQATQPATEPAAAEQQESTKQTKQEAEPAAAEQATQQEAKPAATEQQESTKQTKQEAEPKKKPLKAPAKQAAAEQDYTEYTDYVNNLKKQMADAGIAKDVAEQEAAILMAAAEARNPLDPMAFFRAHPLSFTDAGKDWLRQQDPSYYQSAWHGTPHRFEKFDLGAIGTGEGAQAHGWGLYFAQDKEISENYRKALTNASDFGYQFSINGKNYIHFQNGGLKASDNSELEDGLKAIDTMGYSLSPSPNSKIGEKGVRETINEIIELIKDDFENGYRSGEKPNAENKEKIKKALSTPKHEATDAEVDKIWDIYYKYAPTAKRVSSYDYQGNVKKYKENIKKAEDDIKALLGERRGNAFIKKMEKAYARTLHVINQIANYENHKIALDYLQSLENAELSDYTYVGPGSLFEVDIPENDVLLDEQKFYNDQPVKVKEALNKIIDSLSDEQLGKANVRLWGRKDIIDKIKGDLPEHNGKSIYWLIYHLINDEGCGKQTSLLLNKYGIKGITYKGGRDGRCFVVFDDEAINVINRYNQESSNGTKGAISWDEAGHSVIALLRGKADVTTVIHETGHYFVEALWNDIENGTASEQQIKDFDTLMDYCKMSVDEWRSKDFEGRRPAHERLAEAMETYFMEGKAPNANLRKVFSKIKKWMLDIYKIVQGGSLTGGNRNVNAIEINDEVRQVFDHMLAKETLETTESAKETAEATEPAKEEQTNTEQAQDLQKKKILVPQDVELNQEEAALALAEQMEAEGDKELAALLRSAYQPEEPKKKKKTKKQLAKEKEDAELAEAVAAEERTETLETTSNKEETLDDKLDALINREGMNNKAKSDMRKNREAIIQMAQESGIQLYKDDSTQRSQYYLSSDVNDGEPRKISKTTAEAVSYLTGNLIKPITDDAKKAVKAANKTSKQTLRDVIPADERDEGFVDFLYEEDPSGDTIEAIQNKLAEPSIVDHSKTWYDICEEAAFKDLQLDSGSAYMEQIDPYNNHNITMYYDYLCDKFEDKVHKATRNTKESIIDDLKMGLTDSLYEILKTDDNKKVADARDKIIAYIQEQNRQIDPDNVQEVKQILAEVTKQSRKNAAESTKKAQGNVAEMVNQEVEEDPLENLKRTNPKAYEAFSKKADSIGEIDNASFSIKDKNKNDEQLSSFNPSILSQLLDAGKVLFDAHLSRPMWESIMKSKFAKAARRISELAESMWQFLSKLPQGLVFDANKAMQALQVAYSFFDKTASGKKAKERVLQPNNPLRNYIEAAFSAIKYYPRQNQDTMIDYRKEQANGGNADVNVGVAGLSERSSDSRGNGNQMAEITESQVGEGTQSGEAGNQASNNETSGRAGSENVSRARAALSGTQGNQQGGSQVSGDQGRSTGAVGTQRSAGTVQAGSTGRNGQGTSEAVVLSRSFPRDAIQRQDGQGLESPRLSEYQGKIKEGDADNVRTTLSSYLYDAQCGDVVKAEKRLYTNNSKGMLIANGTGTGKTRSGLGVIARQWLQGKKNILVVVPTQEIGDGWISEGEKCGFNTDDFAQIKTRSHEENHINIITYNSLYQNPSLLKNDWDLVICDESHHLVSKENGTEDNPTKAVSALRAITGHERGFNGWMRMKYPNEYKAADKARKEVAKISRELKQAENLFFDTDLTHMAKIGNNKYEVLARNKDTGKKLTVEIPIDQRLILKLQTINTDAVNSFLWYEYVNDRSKARQEAVSRMRVADAKIRVLENREAPIFEKHRAQAKNDKVLFLSATPFSYDENLYLAEGYLFNYADVGGSYEAMLKEYFGFEPNANGVLKPKYEGEGKFKERASNSANEIMFHDMLINSGAMSKRRLVIDGVDYNRKFIKVKAGIMDEIDKGFDALSMNPNAQSSNLFAYMSSRFNYTTSSKLLESIKAEAAIPLIKKAIANGEHVVLFHDMKKESDFVHPFKLDKEEFSDLTPEQQSAYNDFIKTEDGKEAVAFDAGKLKSVPQIMKEAFGEDTLIINGDEVSDGVREVFNREGDYKKYMEAHKNNPYYGKLVVCTTAKAKEGLSLHDKVGDSPRVLIDVGMPLRPTDLVQLEGRIYRFGQKSNAKFRYLTTGTASEGRMFMNRINRRSKSVENFALGDEARKLDWGLAEAYMQAEVSEEVNENNIDRFEDNENTGGKASDMRTEEEIFKSLQKLIAQKNEMRFSHIQASVKERMARAEAAKEKALRRRILTPDNEIGFLQQLKDSLKIDKPVTKVSDGVYIATLPTGRTLWFDLNTSQAEILARMSESDKARYLKNAGFDGNNREFEIAGYLSKDEARSEIGGNKVDVIHLTEAAQTHTLDHEVMHFVHNALLTNEEKSWLQRYFFYQMKKRMGDTAFNKLSLSDKLARAEEMEAEMYEAFCAEDVKPRSTLEKIFYRMKQWLANFADNLGLHTPFGIYAATRSGKIFNRYTTSNENLTTSNTQSETRQVRDTDDTVVTDALSSVLQQEEQADGTIKYSIKPIETTDGKRMPDDPAANVDEVNSRLAEDISAITNTKVENEEDAKGIKEIVKTFLNVNNKGSDVQVVYDDESQKKGWTASVKEALQSPSRIKNENFKAFFNIFNKAYQVQEHERNIAYKTMNKAMAGIKNAETRQQLSDLLIQGDRENVEYTAQELKEGGVSDEVIKAYRTIRNMYQTLWRKVNDAHRGLKTYNSTMNGEKLRAKLKEFAVENVLVRLPGETDYHKISANDISPILKYEVRYDKPKVYKTVGERLTEEELKKLQADPNVRITKLKQVESATGDVERYEATVERVIGDIGKITGYLPHNFHHWVVFMETKKGLCPIINDASAKTVAEAQKKAKAFLAANPEINPDTLSIRPLLFRAEDIGGNMNDPISKKLGTVSMTDAQYRKATRDIEKQFSVSYREASEMVGTIGKRTSRNRFAGILQHRKGYAGYEANPFLATDRYITIASRYIAMQPAKSTAIPLYERIFKQPFDKDVNIGKHSMAWLIKNYINYCNGTPSGAEHFLNNFLNGFKWYRDNVTANYGERAVISLASGINSIVSKAKLGFFAPSTALVNFFQLSNTFALVGKDGMAAGFKAYLQPTIRDKKVLVESGVINDIGFESATGFSNWRKAPKTRSGKHAGIMRVLDMYNMAADKGMGLFQASEQACRRISVLSAYHDAISKGKTHAQAIEYAKEINRKANFDYGASDTPAFMHALSGTGINELFFLFKKYPVKEFELMLEMLSKQSSKAQKARFWGVYFLLTGLSGFPLGDALDDWGEKLFGIKPLTYAKAATFKQFGDNIATRTLLYGAGVLAGVDTSRRLGMQDALPSAETLPLLATGAAGSTLEQMAQAIATQDSAKIMKAWSPELGNIFEATQGYKTNSKGQITYNYSSYERGLKALGFRPIEEGITSDMQSYAYMDKQRARDKKTKLVQQMARKVLTGEKFSDDEIEQAKELRLTPKTVQDTARKMSMTAKERLIAGLDKRQHAEYQNLPIMRDDDEEK